MSSGGEITNAELARRIEALSLEVRGGLGEIKARLDQYLLREVYTADQRRRDDQLETLRRQCQDLAAGLQAERDGRGRELEKLRAGMRWWWTGVVVPVLAWLVQVVLTVATRG